MRNGDAENDFVCSALENHAGARRYDLHAAIQGEYQQFHNPALKSGGIGVNKHTGRTVLDSELHIG